ncbi:hypothetical protein ACFQVA_29170 [Actinomadura keratinilytica]
MSPHPDPVPPGPEPSVPRARDGRAHREPVRPLLPSPVQELRERPSSGTGYGCC